MLFSVPNLFVCSFSLSPSLAFFFTVLAVTSFTLWTLSSPGSRIQDPRSISETNERGLSVSSRASLLSLPHCLPSYSPRFPPSHLGDFANVLETDTSRNRCAQQSKSRNPTSIPSISVLSDNTSSRSRTASTFVLKQERNEG